MLSSDESYCNCGGIIITGEFINEDDIQETNASVLQLVQSNFTSIFRSEINSIVVTKLSEVDVMQTQTNMYDLVCRSCKCGFRVIIGRDYAYSCPIDDCKIQPTTHKVTFLKRTLSSFFPVNLRRFVTEKRISSQSSGVAGVKSEFTPTLTLNPSLLEMYEDEEVGIATSFSSKQDYIVGSFTDQWIATPEASF